MLPLTGREAGLTKRQHVVRDLRQAIATGQLGPGDKIPTEQHLCQLYGYSRVSVRSAVSELRMLGLIEIRRPHGTYVVDRQPASR